MLPKYKMRVTVNGPAYLETVIMVCAGDPSFIFKKLKKKSLTAPLPSSLHIQLTCALTVL